MKTLWYGGTIYTMEQKFETVEAIVTEDGKIVDGGKVNFLESYYQIEKKINLLNATVYPGFVDSHVHLIGHGEKLSRIDLSHMTSAIQVLEALQKKVSEAKKGEWIIGEGWNENQWIDRKIFHRKELDELSKDHPIVLKRICRHSLIGNSKALQIASIDSSTPNPEGGAIEKDQQGMPTGLLFDQAQEKVLSVIPSPSKEELKIYLNRAIEDAVRKGLTGVHTEDLSYYGSLENTVHAFQEVITEQQFRCHLLVHHHVVKSFQNKKYAQLQSNFLDFGAMKLFADGALGGRTALLSKPYNDAPHTNGIAIHSDEELYDLVRLARSYGMEVAVHTIGDLAFEKMLNVFEQLPPKPDQHDRLIHGQILNPALINRASRMKIIIDIQPSFVASDFPWVIERIGKERIQSCYAWKSLLNKGVTCAGGSDAPIESINPLVGIQSAVCRTSMYEKDKECFFPEQCLSVFEAISLYTKGSAKAIHKEDKRGMIKKGFDADFTILEKDLFKVDPHKIGEVKVSKTVVGGKVVYDNDNIKRGV
ncbi:amidohydrolase [Bacillus carboniphilus]|uniref:Amidohydrolase n=1 Tax=Bacillus carboniphilus TaxID=86663 RepID=A0ABY9JXT0_9BACI|nr:amidohydrolase [Bacillus carboniphilus]WLR44187.1 amidohydrolase [Bacillus carboniphilus]